MSELATARATTKEHNSLTSCVDQMQAEARNEVLEGFSEADIQALAETLWTWSETVEGSGVRLWSIELPDAVVVKRHVLEVVGPDRPFLVDSLLGACADLGHEVLALFHPIIDTASGKRSLIQIHFPELSEEEGPALIAEAKATLNDVAIATGDYGAMRDRMLGAIAELEASQHITQRYKSEAVEFLKWLGQEHFVFLGAREYRFNTAPDGTVLPEEPEIVEGSNLGLLRDETRNVLNRGSEPLLLTEKISAFLSEPESLILAKATLMSRVHRRVACDYVGVKKYDEAGKMIGEIRFLGLYTSEAYNQSVRKIPLLRKRVERVIHQIGALPGTHNEQALFNIMEMWPRDEVLQTKSEKLAPLIEGALHLIGRPRVRLFVRTDRFNRFASIIVFIPREAYNTDLRRKITDLIEDAWEGRVSSFQPSFDGASLVRVLYQVELPGETRAPDTQQLETRISEMARSWRDHFHQGLAETAVPAKLRNLMLLFSGGFNAAYREAYSVDDAIVDVTAMSELDADTPIKLRAYQLPDDEAGVIRAKIYSRNGAIALSDCIPVFERMGLFVARETGYPVQPAEKPAADAPDVYWIHSLKMRHMAAITPNMGEIYPAFEQAFVAIWSHQAENDGFNALVLNAGLNWREAALCRALSAYRKQTGLDPAEATQIEAFNTYPRLTRNLLKLFYIRFDPEFTEDRQKAAERCLKNLNEGLKSVSALDHDRIFNRTIDLIQAIQRTNFFQTTTSGAPYPYIAFKIASRELADLPAPKPHREIFVSSPIVDGVHCRFGPVARGGLRWSDRRDDFRTEVLGLVKAQQVKNAVIVPVGSKGGFFPKQLPVHGSRETLRQAGIQAYRIFITALLDLTDNLIDGAITPPQNTVIHDGDDPYLVVAADKGTATFSDIANEISLSLGFWLGDAFASGGSAGYDHKKMGITARGAWEAVKRHFRELGKDIQTEPFTVIGCGDMSGDVFGNGMLLSRQIRLQAAFNHMHIFIDPNPGDPETLWQERQRLFDLPRSSWTDYDQSLISAGGGIFERAAKAIPLSPEIKALTGLEGDEITPDELIHALLKTQCELLWFGGIGTYIKASHETHTAAGDRANDGLRVDARELSAKVIGEGANLGLTQAGRIEAAENGVNLNSDAIDNSAGVDSSDHEVNIKILCAEAMRRGVLPRGERNALLAAMTDDVAAHVLAHNYAQTGALSLAAETARSDHDGLERLMLWLESRGVLDRTVEGLPDSIRMAARKTENRPLTRPEISILMAWTKIVLFDDLVASDVPDDPALVLALRDYFPKALHVYEETMQSHRLKREIIATVLSNRIIDVNGPVFLLRLHEQTGAEMARIVACFEAARDLIHAKDRQTQINAFDNQTSAHLLMQLQQALATNLFDLTAGMLHQGLEGDIESLKAQMQPTVDAIRSSVPEQLSKAERARYTQALALGSEDAKLTDLVSVLSEDVFTTKAALIAGIKGTSETDQKQSYATYQLIGQALGLDTLRHAAHASLSDMPYWDKLATRKLLRELEQQQAKATQIGLQQDSFDVWFENTASARLRLTSEIETLTVTTPSFAQLALAADAVRTFMDSLS